MPRRATEPKWIERVRELTANEPRLGARAVAIRLQLEGADAPSERTVSRIQADFAKLDERTRAAYHVFTWPEHMEAGFLPWEAGAALLELLHDLDRENAPHPLVSVARWYWRVTLAAPAAPIGERYRYARQLAGAEILGEPNKTRDYHYVAGQLAHRSWDLPPPAPATKLTDTKLITAGEMHIDAEQSEKGRQQ